MTRDRLSGWKARKAARAYILSTLGVCLLIAVMAGPASGFSFVLHSKGVWSASCNAGTLTSHQFDRPALKSGYAFKGSCVESVGQSVTNRWYTVEANWNGSNKTAQEFISGTFYNDHVAGSVHYTCPDDPWLNAVDCTITGKAGDIFNFIPEGVGNNPFQTGKSPISATFISPAQKQSLKAEWDKQPALGTPPAPTILSPSPGQGFLPPAKVPIKVQHNPNYGVAFEFQRISLVSSPVPKFWTKQQVAPANLKTNAGQTSGELAVNEPGKWRFRSQSVFPGAPWSDWREFVVDQLSKVPPLENKIPPNVPPIENKNIQTVPPPDQKPMAVPLRRK